MNIITAHQVKITIDFGKLQSVVDWCERNCEEDWGYNTISNICVEYPYRIHQGEYQFYFESERDFVAFTMWKK